MSDVIPPIETTTPEPTPSHEPNVRLYLDSSVGYIINQLLVPKNGTKLFSTNFQNGIYLQACLGKFLVTALVPEREKLNGYMSERELSLSAEQTEFYSGNARFYAHPQIEMFKPLNKFHYGFTFPHCEYDPNTKEIVYPQYEDRMLFFECSKSTTAATRTASAQLMALEQMYLGLLYGGFFAAVLPRKWIGKNMRYGKWWNDQAATVARIALPSKVIVNESNEPVDTNANWDLYIWTKPAPRQQNRHKLLFAEFRYTTFIYRMHDTDEDETAIVRRAFRKHDWYQKYVTAFNSLLQEQEFDPHYGTVNAVPVKLADPKEVRLFIPTEKTQPTYKVAASRTEIMADKLAVHIIPGPPVRLRTYDPVATATLLDFQSMSEQIKIKGSMYKPAKAVDKFTYDLRRKHFSSCKEELIKSLLEQGLVPYILASDLSRMQKQEKSLLVNLTPFERLVKVTSVDPDGADRTEWEAMYSEVGMRVMHPEIFKMWEQRAKQMKMDKVLYPFQFNDNVLQACHTSVLNSNVMGLGKTMEALLLKLLRGVKHTLIVVESKLIGVWQNEIETNVAAYIRRARTNWMGERMFADYQVIEWAEQCRKENLKTFNIISMERISSVPRDAKFFRCPKCGFIVCSPRGGLNKRGQQVPQPCPNKDCDNFGRRQKCKQINAMQSLKKYKEINGHVIDERVLPDALTMMEEWAYKEPKERRVPSGVETVEERDEDTGLLSKVTRPTYRIEKKSPHFRWTFAELLRHSFNNIIIDEAQAIKNPDALRSKAVDKLVSRHKMTLSGTPIRGYPQSLLHLLNWTFKRALFSDYRKEDSGAAERFLDKYGTYVKNEDTGKWKLIPKVNNPEQLQAEGAPLMLRHTRDEPPVVKDIPQKLHKTMIEKIDMDTCHREFYKKWLDKFTEWFEAKQKEEGKSAGGEILTKLTYLANAATIPHHMFESLMKKRKDGKFVDEEGASWAAVIGPYKRADGTEPPPTATQLRTRELIQQAMQRGEKTIAFSRRRANLKSGYEWSCRQSEPPIYSMIVDGKVSNKILAGTNRSAKQQMVDDFNNEDYNVMWAGLSALSVGLNIPAANNGIFMNYEWEPTVHRQALGRMLRPQQMRTVNAYYLVHKGTIEEYMMLLAILKARSMDEVVDYMEYADFSHEEIPDVNQYVKAIIDGTEDIKKAKMWLAAEEILRHENEEDDEFE